MTAGDAAHGSLEALRERNRLRVVDALRRNGSATRTELARLTGLSRTTIASLVADLQASSLVVERTAPSRRGGRGRPAAVLALHGSAGAALGLDFGHSHVRVALADLSSTVLAEEVVELDVDHDAIAALDAAAELCERIIAASGVDRARIIGAGMGLSGPIDRETGTVAAGTILPSWDGLRPAQELGRRLGLHVELDNDANLGARAEHWYGAGRGYSDFVYVQLRAGIGGALVLGGRLHYGASGYAGELGHVLVQPDGVLCRCGSRGCLETVASAEALLTAMRAVRGPELTIRGLLDLVQAGDVGATRMVGDAGRAVGRVLADLCNLVNPAAVIVGGELAGAGAPLLDGIRSAIDRRALARAADAVDVMVGVLGERAEMLGALALVIGNTNRIRSAGLVPLTESESPVLVP